MPRNKSFVFLSVLFALLMFKPTLQAWAADWPRWRGPDGNGISSERDWEPKNVQGNPDILWTASVGSGYSSVAVAGGYVYTMGNERNVDTVICLDAATGKTVWTHTYSCPTGSYPGPRSTPLVEGGIVYTVSREGHVFALRGDSGRVVWSRHLRNDFGVQPPSWGFAGSPVASGGLLILNAGKSGMALDLKTGERVWDSGRGPGSYATPVFFDYRGTRAAAVFGGRALYAVDAAKGSVLWSYPWVTGSDVNAADPVIADGKAFMASGYDHGSAVIDFSSGKPKVLWESSTFETHFSSFVLIDGYLYGNDGDSRSPTSGTFNCVEFDTGRVMWSARLGFGSLIAAGDRLVMLNYAGVITVARLTPDGYYEIASGSLPRSQYWTPPVIAHSRLYCRSVRGELYCIDLD